MKVLIPGGFGYLGGRLARFLASRAGDEVTLGSRQTREVPPWLPQARTVRTPWDSPSALQRICSGIDAIVNLSGMNARDCAADPIEALECNAVATARLVRAAKAAGVRRFIYVSTAHVYGSPLVGEVTERSCAGSVHPYASSHRAGEDAILWESRDSEIECLVIRLSNAYGAPADKDADCWTLLFNDLCRQAATTRHMVLRSSGLQRRDFVPMNEVCRAIGHLLRSPWDVVPQNIVNVGKGASTSVWEAACLVRDRCNVILGFCPELERVQPKSGESAAGFDYCVDTLRRSGFETGDDRIEEVDRLLEFCADTFVSEKPR